MTNATLIFGATGAIGGSLARRLVARGQQVVVSGRDEARLDAIASELGAPALLCDATDAAQVDSTLAAALGEFDNLDGVVHCVGSVLLKPAHSTSLDEWSDVMRVNLDSAFHVVRAAARPFMKTGGSIVLVSSAAAQIGLPNHEAIAAAKAGVAGLTRAAAATYANRNVRVNCVAPGLVRSGITEGIFASDMARKASEAMHALPRLGEPDDVAGAIEWLLSSAWVTGQVLGVDGGLGSLKTRARA